MSITQTENTSPASPTPEERRAGRPRPNVQVPTVDLPWLPKLPRDDRHNVVLVGLNRRSRQYLEGVQAYRSKRVRVVCVLDTEAFDTREPPPNQQACLALLEEMRIPHLGSVANLTRVLVELPIDEVHVTLPLKSCYDDIDGVLAVCEEAGVAASLTTDLFEHGSARQCLMVDGRSGAQITYSCAQRTAWDRFLKRGLDVCGSLFGLTLLALPMLFIALAVKLTSRGPVFFSQERSGLNHRPFRMLKFRTMVQNAEALKRSLEKDNEMSGPAFKIKHDPRITPLGRILRKFSLDELPQLVNVLRGDMSLVGPRPPILREVSDYEWWQRRRLSTRPGLTCFWQISGRNEIDFEEWMRLDLRYIDNWSILLDVKLILATIPAVLVGRGAS